jgi:hypothetical protein
MFGTNKGNVHHVDKQVRGSVGKGLHNPVDHLVHIFGHHHGPLGLLRRHSLGYDSHLVLH